MGHLDGRFTADETPAAPPAGGTKDGPTGQKTDAAPKKEDADDRSLAKASDVVHPGTAGVGQSGHDEAPVSDRPRSR